MKPPVVVIERHCKTNQCGIAVRFKKIQSVAKISQSIEEERADDALLANEFHGRVAETCFIFVMHARASVEGFDSRPRRRFFSLATDESVPARPKKYRVKRSAFPVTPDDGGTPIIMRACRNDGRGPRIIGRNARNARARSAPWLPFRPASPVYKPPPINRVGDPSRLHSFRLSCQGRIIPPTATSTCASAGTA